DVVEDVEAAEPGHEAADADLAAGRAEVGDLGEGGDDAADVGRELRVRGGGGFFHGSERFGYPSLSSFSFFFRQDVRRAGEGGKRMKKRERGRRRRTGLKAGACGPRGVKSKPFDFMAQIQPSSLVQV